MDIEPVPFLDVATLLESSEPRSYGGWLWYALGAFLLILLLGEVGGSQATLLQGLSIFLMLCLLGGMAAMTWFTVRRHRAEQFQLQAIEELIQLRRWSEAATLLQAMLSQPMRAQASRIQALVYLASVLARYHRFPDAIAIQEYLLEHVRMDPAQSYGLRLGRAMAMLREDHLLDADRAISELRRLSSGHESGGLALVEIYRDVKTGHPNEAVEIFTRRVTAMRDQLGHRVADAYALLARAQDMLGRSDEARAAWADATTLAPGAELVRRYPELDAVAGKYFATSAPAGLA